MVAIPLRIHAPFVLVAMSLFWCGAVAGMLILHSTNASEPGSAPVRATDQPRPIHVIAVRNALPPEPATSTTSPASVTFDDRWSAREPEPALPTAVKDARAQVATAESKPAAPELRREPQDAICGPRGRYYFYIERHKYWRCRR